MTRTKTLEKQITGIVLPSDWDARDQLVEVVLYGNDESEHVITGGLCGRFLGLSHHRVRARGREMLHNGRRYLDVSDYDILGTGVDSGYDPESLNTTGQTG